MPNLNLDRTTSPVSSHGKTPENDKDEIRSKSVRGSIFGSLRLKEKDGDHSMSKKTKTKDSKKRELATNIFASDGSQSERSMTERSPSGKKRTDTPTKDEKKQLQKLKKFDPMLEKLIHATCTCKVSAPDSTHFVIYLGNFENKRDFDFFRSTDNSLTLRAAVGMYCIYIYNKKEKLTKN